MFKIISVQDFLADDVPRGHQQPGPVPLLEDQRRGDEDLATRLDLCDVEEAVPRMTVTVLVLFTEMATILVVLFCNHKAMN